MGERKVGRRNVLETTKKLRTSCRIWPAIHWQRTQCSFLQPCLAILETGGLPDFLRRTGGVNGGLKLRGAGLGVEPDQIGDVGGIPVFDSIIRRDPVSGDEIPVHAVPFSGAGFSLANARQPITAYLAC